MRSGIVAASVAALVGSVVFGAVGIAEAHVPPRDGGTASTSPSAAPQRPKPNPSATPASHDDGFAPVLTYRAVASANDPTAWDGLTKPARGGRLSRAEIRKTQLALHRLGLPEPRSDADGIQGRWARRAVCAWREITGRPAQRGLLTHDEAASIRSLKSLPEASDLIPAADVAVSKACQVAYWLDGRRIIKVFPVSTGRPGMETRNGDYRVFRRIDGWHMSNEFPSSRPTMLKPLYFSGGQALHGTPAQVHPWPASHGCVRFTPSDITELFPHMPLKSHIVVYGTY